MRISDWSSDVCSSDLRAGLLMSEDDISMAPTPFEEGEHGRAPSRWRRLAICAAAVLGALAVLVAGLSAYLNSDPGKRMLVRQIGKIETASGLCVQIVRLEGSIYSSMTIHNLVVDDPQGVFQIGRAHVCTPVHHA